MSTRAWPGPIARAAAAGAFAVAAGGCAPQSVLTFRGASSAAESRLGWFLVVTASVVVVIIAVLVVAAWWRARPYRDGDELVAAPASGLSWIMIGGVIVPSVVLLAAFLLTIITLNATAAPDAANRLTVQVTGHQWWWEVRYNTGAPSGMVTTANEIHIPAGRPVRLELQSGDVIHSFWVPELAGKTDVIPGQTNVTWLEARRPGIYTGHCGEYCGMQHAHMQVVIVAQTPAAFAAWLAAQRDSAVAPADPVAMRGQRVFLSSPCASCHTIRGTPAGGRVGPDLTHLASRTTLAAGTLDNTPLNLERWINNAQLVKPGAAMPPMLIAPGDLQPLVHYLETLH